jgi:hypothetical protein
VVAVVALPENVVAAIKVKPVIVLYVEPKERVDEPKPIVELVREALGMFVAPKDAESPAALTRTVIPTPATNVKVSIAASG